MTNKKMVKELKIGDTFLIEFGAYENWTMAIIKDIQPIENNPDTLRIFYTIPHYCGEEIHNETFCKYRNVKI